MYFLADFRCKIIGCEVCRRITARRLRGVDAVRGRYSENFRSSCLNNKHACNYYTGFVEVYEWPTVAGCAKLMSHFLEIAIRRNLNNNSFFHTMHVLFQLARSTYARHEIRRSGLHSLH